MVGLETKKPPDEAASSFEQQALKPVCAFCETWLAASRHDQLASAADCVRPAFL
jgi:hypothetical protein